MIYDYSTEMTLTPPTGSAIISYSAGSVDLAEGGDGIGPALAGGDQLYLHCEVTVAFAADAGTPLAQFGIALGNATPMSAGDDTLVLGMSGGPSDGTALVGHVAGQLSAGTTFFLPIPRWDDIIEAAAAKWPNTVGSSELTAFRAYRYMALCCQNVAGTPASNDFNTDGRIKARVVHRTGNTDPLSNTYPSRMEVN